MKGFGQASFATHPFALGVADSATAPNRAMYKAREFNALNQDFESSNSLGFTSQTPTRERISFLLLTSRGSASALPTLGAGVANITKVDGTFVNRVRNDVRRALKPITTDEKLISVEAIDISFSRGRVSVSIRYQDLRTNDQDSISV